MSGPGPLNLPQADAPPPRNPHLIGPHMIFSVALLGIACWAIFCGIVLYRGPTVEQVASMQQQAFTFAQIAFGFFLGSSASSKNKDHL